MSTQHSTISATCPTPTRRAHQVDRLQVTLVLALLALAIFASIQLNHLALALTR